MKISNWLAARTRQLWLTLAAAAALTVLACGACAVIFTPWLPGAETVTVPDVAASGLDAVADDPDFSITTELDYSAAPLGSVISQSPAPGEQRKVSRDRPCRITVTLSRGPRSVTMPTLVGLDGSTAEARLRALGLDVVTENVSGPAGQVVSTAPAAGEQLPSGDCVTLRVGCDSVTVPELRGLSETAALRLLERLGLCPARSEYEHSSCPAGTVTRQSVAPGTALPSGGCVTLTVSLG